MDRLAGGSKVPLSTVPDAISTFDFDELSGAFAERRVRIENGRNNDYVTTNLDGEKRPVDGLTFLIDFNDPSYPYSMVRYEQVC